jgi:hypothetical protein
VHCWLPAWVLLCGFGSAKQCNTVSFEYVPAPAFFYPAPFYLRMPSKKLHLAHGQSTFCSSTSRTGGRSCVLVSPRGRYKIRGSWQYSASVRVVRLPRRAVFLCHLRVHSSHEFGNRLHVCKFLPFLAKRVVRITPSYCAAIVLCIVLGYVSAQSPVYEGAPYDVSVRQLLGNIFYLAEFVAVDWFNPVFWTLAIEFQFYILLGLLWPVISRLSVNTRCVRRVYRR